MRNSEKDRAKRKDRKQRLEIKAKKMACKHPRRSAQGSDNGCKLVCHDCGEIITMLSNTVFGKGMDPQAKRNEAHRKNG